MPSNYSEDINKLREERKQSRLKMKQYTEAIEAVLDRFNVDEGPTLIPVSEFQYVEVGVPFHVNDKVYFVKQHSLPNELHFKTYMQPGGTFGMQSHDVPETCKVLKGCLIEETQNNKRINIGESITYPAYEVHKPSTDTDTIIDVFFKINESLNVTPE